MPTILQNVPRKIVPNIAPISQPTTQSNPSPTFSNIRTPFNKGFQNNPLLQNGNIIAPAPKPSISLPIPGEGLPRVLHYCADQSGCAFWRLIWPANELLAHNKAVVMTLYQMVTLGQFYGGIDAVRLQRQCTEPQLEFIKFLRNVSDQMKKQTGKGFRIIWEVDDIVCPAEDIPDYNVCKSAFEGEKVHNILKEVVKYIDEMTVVSDFMRKHYQKHLNFDKITVIPNYAPKNWIDVSYDEIDIATKHNSKRKPRVLYAGSGTHFDVANKVNQKDDFGHVVDAIIHDITVDKKYEWVFFGAIPLKLSKYVNSKDIEFHQWTAITDYSNKVKDLNVDFAIAPLKTNNFSRAKANIKLTESGMQGIPCIAQDIECYNSDGWDLLFNNAGQLFSIIDELWSDKKKYTDASKKCREYSEKFILSDHLDEFVLLYTTEYGDAKRKENSLFYKNNPIQFS